MSLELAALITQASEDGSMEALTGLLRDLKEVEGAPEHDAATVMGALQACMRHYSASPLNRTCPQFRADLGNTLFRINCQVVRILGGPV